MSQTVSIQKIISREDIAPKRSLQDWVLGMLARMIPMEQLQQPTQAEAIYLQPFYRTFDDIPRNQRSRAIQEAIKECDAEERNLIQLVGQEDASVLDSVALILCYLVETNPMAGRCIAYLQQPVAGSRPTLSLLSTISCESGLCYGESDRTVIARIINSKAVQLGLLQVLNESAPLPERSVKLHTPVALNLADDAISWPGAFVGIPATSLELPQSIASQASLQAESLCAGSSGVLVIRSPSGKEKVLAADHIARFADHRPLFIENQDKALTALGPVCKQKRLLPVLSYDCSPGDQVLLPEIKGYQGPIIVLAGHEGAFESKNGSVTSWTLPRPTYEERRQLWQTHLGNQDLAQQLAGDHVHGMDRIVELARLAKRQTIIKQKEETGLDEILEAAWLRESKGLSLLAQPVKADVTDKTLIVRPQTRDQLRLLAQRCRLRERLADRLGITLQARYQMGVKALFTGPSGTGKTLASSWLANKLGFPLYRVDLAAITSKYIGETEKNLARLLGQAEQEEVVLLFDEADALFGKRTEVSNANDRFANAQTNYLLQRIETYTGVVILTSNSKARFDAAFTRRLDMMIDFPLPDPEERRLIWLNHLGTYHSLNKGNINQLAMQCDLSGGHIRNVVLTAAVIAKHADRKISLADIVVALVDEYRKLGKQMSPELKRGGRNSLSITNNKLGSI